jgi:hypothetical protein
MREHLDTYTLEAIARAATGAGEWPSASFHLHSH